MKKSAEAFRTISEVAGILQVQKHVLRFWEIKFPQIKPLKRGGGRRYYRPADVELLRGIRALLHDDGYTIKGVQKILREEGVDHVKERASGGSLPVVAAKRGRRKTTASPAQETARAGARPAGLSAAQRKVVTKMIGELQQCRELLTGGTRSGVDSRPPLKALAS